MQLPTTMSQLRNIVGKEKNIHLIFEISLIGKALFAALEVVGGVIAYFVSQDFLLTVVTNFTQDELAEDPHDLVANYLLHTAQNFSIGAQHFTALYLASHGVIKLFVIAGLLREKLWYYPTALVVFGLFIIYQLYRFSFTHSVWLIVLSVVDAAIMLLTWHEYQYLRRVRAAAAR